MLNLDDADLQDSFLNTYLEAEDSEKNPLGNYRTYTIQPTQPTSISVNGDKNLQLITMKEGDTLKLNADYSQKDIFKNGKAVYTIEDGTVASVQNNVLRATGTGDTDLVVNIQPYGGQKVIRLSVISGGSSTSGQGGSGDGRSSDKKTKPTSSSVTNADESRAARLAAAGQGNTFISDTTEDFAVSGDYTFKITSKNGWTPDLVIGTAGVFEATLVKRTGNDWFYKLTVVGQPGGSAGIYINGGARLLVATVKTTSAPNTNQPVSDTTLPVAVKAGAMRAAACGKCPDGSGKSGKHTGRAPVFQ